MSGSPVRCRGALRGRVGSQLQVRNAHTKEGPIPSSLKHGRASRWGVKSEPSLDGSAFSSKRDQSQLTSTEAISPNQVINFPPNFSQL